MLDKRVSFGGEDVPAFIASVPEMPRPRRKGKTYTIAGTNREIVEMEDAWETYDQKYTMFIGNGSEDCVRDAIDEVSRVLNKDGWQILMDDYDPDHYRLAYFKDSFNVDNRYTRLGKFDIVFHCRPERFLVSGNTEISLASGSTIYNPTGFNAKPLIHIVGEGDGMLTVNGTTMSFEGITDYLNIDCDKMDVYRLPSENRNSLMTGDFPVLSSGNNLVSYSGGISSVTITPKFWTI